VAQYLGLPSSPPHDDGSQLNCSILHASRRLYNLGIEAYYSTNTFVFEVDEHRGYNGNAKRAPEDSVSWLKYRTPIAAQAVRYIIVTKRGFSSWE